MNSFGQTFKFIREGKGKSLAEVARGHLSTSQLSRFENGESDITISKLFGVLAELNVDFDEYCYASQDFQRDELTIILEQLRQSIYGRDIMKIRKMLSDQLVKAQGDYRREFYRLNAVLIKIKLSDLDQVTKVSLDELTYLTDYLFRVENWGYYELTLFANTMDELNHSCTMLFCRELIKRTQYFSEIRQNRNVLSQILLNAYLVCIDRNKLSDAVYLEKIIKNNFFEETAVFDRILFRYGKGFYDYKKNKDQNGILEMRKCIGLLRAVDSQNIADWYEKCLENVIVND
ncbi:helix-turn-helix domain-containing protein [Streptococcus suis]|uniref:Transcriptional regulator n=1 Tax=Streptococcus suis TaxID=1307 RepID=A0A116RJN1_STRSU|nr:Rgg/GadR/MutR family transcriptional regulator [Streptococcus suis]NQH26622.1 helix-turn-helix domain-containing protein [Streptococcus suis]NQH31817.1 helix-turn-helix domain-containing protein [Streptococcus suis]NQH47462.1 helix-turn-helix domain-containing protein [Streptococcus suis]NQH53654.1 helix-turn-helix domain-containing protein [Streptococcus suis]NQH63553.1 helix-turn-helix domain-containing protein [Streptococcus suis]